jgi:hypothetical protein
LVIQTFAQTTVRPPDEIEMSALKNPFDGAITLIQPARKKRGSGGSANRPRAIEVNRPYRPSQRDHFAQHSQAVAKKTNFASFGVIPADWNFPNAQSGALGDKKQLDVERETIDPRCLQNRSADVEPKRLESALRIPKREAGCDAHEQIENTASLFSPPRLVNAD